MIPGRMVCRSHPIDPMAQRSGLVRENVSAEAQAKKTFTGSKFDILDALASDRQISNHDFRVAYRVMQAVNQNTGTAILSDAILVDEVGTDSKRLWAARNRLEELGWWEVGRGSGHRGTRYRFLDHNLNGILDQRLIKRDARAARRAERHRANGQAQTGMVPVPDSKVPRGGIGAMSGMAPAPPVHLQTPSVVSQGRKNSTEVVEFSAGGQTYERDDWPTDAEVRQADFDERAAIMECDGGMTRDEAEAAASSQLSDWNDFVDEAEVQPVGK